MRYSASRTNTSAASVVIFLPSMRNKLIHDYGHVDLELVWAVVQKDLPLLEPQIRQILNEQ